MSNFDRDELEECFKAYGIGHVDSHVLAEALVLAGFRKIFDGDGGLSNVDAPDDREASEAWMRWANLNMDESLGAIGAMKQMLAELGYRKVRE